MNTIDREKLEKRIDEMIELSKSYSDQSDWDKGYRRALNDLKREIQSGEFGLREMEPPALKPGDRVRHRTNKHFILGEVLEISKTGKSAYVKWIEYDRKRFRIFPPYPAYYTIKYLEKVEEPNHD